MPRPTKAEIAAEIDAQLQDATVPDEIKEYLRRDIKERAVFHDLESMVTRAWTALKSRSLSLEQTRRVVSFLIEHNADTRS